MLSCRLIGFAFDCGEESLNAGLSIPLLSVGLATLMALFRDPDLSRNVSQDDLTVLIRETGTALLDPRLASSSNLDEATASQMVRAINKVRTISGYLTFDINPAHLLWSYVVFNS
jgi:hypothetical protein